VQKVRPIVEEFGVHAKRYMLGESMELQDPAGNRIDMVSPNALTGFGPMNAPRESTAVSLADWTFARPQNV
jgi:hypothetical protein